ncbi:hypothetical protein CCHL11_03400 [Colletotrichum chlorophyti]|uniref:Uncharacterized protein n=1 Tax=Colletotrichum chlorophyti TaxID=708187 RepID=A0A1Q8S007_9PEZI|nr:hypothetical protein CCHL11_03400 [Colletotrichum chlorophyti]
MDFLRSSKKGRSRFSKALPAPPPLEKQPLSASKQLPSVPPVPPVPSKKVSAMSDKPLPPPQQLDQSLPPLPHLETKALPFMHIPRRPVAKQAPPPPTQSQQQPEPQDDRNSIGSLLSAYSRSSGESLIMSPDGSASQRGSVPTYTSEQDTAREAKINTPNSLSSSGDNEVPHSHYGAQKFTPHKGLPPPPEFQDERAPPPPAKTVQSPAVQSPTGLESPSSPQRPIWRRRSVKSDRNIEVHDLKLAVSHGSTAASHTDNAQPAYSAGPTSSHRQFPPRSTSNLPGRNVRPVRSQDQHPPVQEENMGQEASRLKQKIAHLRGGEEDAHVGTSHSDTALSPTQRLPTPDYEREDVRTPVVDTVVSPISPASSPEPAHDQAGTEPKSAIPRKAVTTHNVHAARSLPQMRVDEPVTNSEAPPTVTRDFAINPDPQAQHPPRSTSNQQRSHMHPPPREYTPYAPPSRAVAQGDMRSASREQRAETAEYRELQAKDLPPADPHASYFPMHGSEPVTPGIIYNAPPLKESMFDCYVKHRTMDRSRNRNYPLTCQTCAKADTEDRFKCQWCYVRMCASCLQIFNSNRRDLRKLMAHLEGNPLSGGSQTRPATAGGVEPAGVRTEEQQRQQLQAQAA